MFSYLARIICITLVYFTSITQAQAAIKIAVTDWPPYYSKTAENGGQQLELLTNVFLKLGEKVEPVWFRTGAGALVKVRANLLDGAAGWECNEERANDFIFSDPIGYEQTVIFYHKDFNFDWQNIEDLNRDLTIGITARYAYGKGLKALFEMDKAIVEVSGSDRKNLDLLFHREIDLFLLDKEVGLGLIKQAKASLLGNIKIHDKAFRKNRVAIRLLVSRKQKNAQSFIDKFNKVLGEIRKEKGLTKIAPEKYDACPKINQ